MRCDFGAKVTIGEGFGDAARFLEYAPYRREGGQTKKEMLSGTRVI
jgi:hypothetical protein